MSEAKVLDENMGFGLVDFTMWVEEADGSWRIVDTTVEQVAKEHNLMVSHAFKPWPIIIGMTPMIPGMRKALVGMKEGEEKTVILAPEDAFGAYDNRARVRVKKSDLERYGYNQVGARVQLGGRIGTVVQIGERFAVIDFNHPWAGRHVKLWLHVVKVITDPAEKAKILVQNFLNPQEMEVKAEGEEVAFTVSHDVLENSSLEVKLSVLGAQIKGVTGAKRVRATIII